MTTTLFIIGYLLVATIFFVRLYRWIYVGHMQPYITLGWRREDRWFAVAWGGCVAICWPMSGAIFLAVSICKGFARIFDGPLRRLESVILRGLR